MAGDKPQQYDDRDRNANQPQKTRTHGFSPDDVALDNGDFA
jgi:hypothetical protein